MTMRTKARPVPKFSLPLAVAIVEVENTRQHVGRDTPSVVKIENGRPPIISSNFGHWDKITSFDNDVYTYKVTYKFKLTIK